MTSMDLTGRWPRELHGAKVLVTGGTGGIGGRLIETLVQDLGADVRVLVRNLTKTPRVARYPVELVVGDVTSASEVRAAVQGCDYVFHCAHGNTPDPDKQRAINVDGTRHVLEACAGTQVKRLVHLSTCRVFGMITPDGDLDETAPMRRDKSNAYADSKVEAEELVQRYVRERGVPATIIQPTTVYGPFVQVWTEAFMKKLSRGRAIMVNGGDGLCNAVYVDDVVAAILLAAVQERAVGESFLISGAQPVSWRAFHERFGALVGGLKSVDMSVDEAKAHYAAWAREQRCRSVFTELPRIVREEREARKRVRATCEVSTLIKLVHRLRPQRPARKGKPANPRKPALKSVPEPILPLSPSEVDYFAAKTRFRIDKARELLGYRPAFDLDAGMVMTEAWAQWANRVTRDEPRDGETWLAKGTENATSPRA